jgi:Peptidase A4 family
MAFYADTIWISGLRRRLVVLAALACIFTAANFVANAGAASATMQTSENWSGYVAYPLKPHARFRNVSGQWIVPAATCPVGQRSYASQWVGLGGARSHLLEQTGTEVECSPSGHATYSAWWEVLPQPSQPLHFRVRPGDHIAASATVRGTHVTLRLSNLTTGKRWARSLHEKRNDGSSAEWIVEAPMAPLFGVLPLADFGTVQWTSATAAIGSHVGAANDPAWSAEPLELRQEPAPGALATPTAMDGGQGSFAVTWSEIAARSEAIRSSSQPRLPSPKGATGGSGRGVAPVLSLADRRHVAPRVSGLLAP